jgi:hypothetical protein
VKVGFLARFLQGHFLGMGNKQIYVLARRLLLAGFVKKPRQHYGVAYVSLRGFFEVLPHQRPKFTRARNALYLIPIP